MSVLFWAIALIILAVVIHIIIWRMKVPQNQTRALIEVFLGTFTLGILLLWGFSHFFVSIGIFTPQGLDEYLQLSCLFIALTLVYIVSFPGVEVDSPSLVMVMEIVQAGPQGLAKDVLKQKMNDDVLLIPRIRDLVAGGMAYLDGKTYRLKPKGMLVARIFTGYRKLIRKAEKGG